MVNNSGGAFNFWRGDCWFTLLPCRTRVLLSEQRAEKTRIMQRILHNDAQIRYLAEPWLMHCEQNLEGQRQFLH